MAFPNRQLFLNRFIAVNKARYSHKPAFLAALDRLTLTDVVFTNPRTETLPFGKVKHVIDMAVPGLFTAFNQKYLPGNLPDHGVANLVSIIPLNDFDLERKLDPGIYWRLTGVGTEKQGAVLVLRHEKNAANIAALVKASSLFDLTDANVVVSADLSSVTINSSTVVGNLIVVESLGDIANAIYDGEYTYDGTLTY